MNALDKAKVFLEALPYLKAYDRRFVVIKIGGSTMTDEKILPSVVRDAVFLEQVGVWPIIVHGGGPRITEEMERRGMTVLTAGTGREAISTLESMPDVAIVLMDIMMPEMDGYATMQVIRQNPSLRRLPIVALTAKAMKGDREKCLEAGASEYLAKPVNTDQLLSALRMWLHR